MFRWARWYRNLLLAWSVIAVPGFVLGIGFGGGSLQVPRDFVGALLWFLAVFFVLSPIILWPWRGAGK